MHRNTIFGIFVCLVMSIGPGISADEPEIQPVLSDYGDSNAIESASESYGECSAPILDLYQREINKIIEADIKNTIVTGKAHEILIDAKCDSRIYDISHICAIFDYMVNGWHWIGDPRGSETFRYPNQTIQIGGSDRSGSGDCDDFAILMSCLLEEIGGTTRIILAYGPKEGHAYTQVYLGNAGDPQIEEIVEWLKAGYSKDDIVVDMRPNGSEVWLNLDYSASNPGGPLYSEVCHKIISIRGNTSKGGPAIAAEPKPLPSGVLEIKIYNLSDEFGVEAEVNGTISGNLPDDQYIWLLINPHSAPGQWWPQGGRIEPDLQSGTWHGVARIGGGLGDIGKKFDVAVVRVSKEDDQELYNWTKTGAVHNWSSISLPDSAILMDKKTVTARGPEIAIVDPEDESEVNITAEVNGTISTISGKLPDDYYLWLLVNPHSCSRQWWPQGCSEPNFLKGTWYVQAGFGGVNDTGTKFDIAAILVDKDDHKELEEVMKTGQSMPMPGDAKIMDRITVTRK